MVVLIFSDFLMFRPWITAFSNEPSMKYCQLYSCCWMRGIPCGSKRSHLQPFASFRNHCLIGRITNSKSHVIDHSQIYTAPRHRKSLRNFTIYNFNWILHEFTEMTEAWNFISHEKSHHFQIFFVILLRNVIVEFISLFTTALCWWCDLFAVICGKKRLDCSWWGLDSWLQSPPCPQIRSWTAPGEVQNFNCSHFLSPPPVIRLLLVNGRFLTAVTRKDQKLYLDCSCWAADFWLHTFPAPSGTLYSLPAVSYGSSTF